MSADPAIVDAFAAADLFAGLPRGDIERIAASAKRVHHPAGKHLTSQGDAGVGFHMILDGTATVVTSTGHQHRIGKGAYFESFLGSVRRANQYSFWTPLTDQKKHYIRVKTWFALVRMHETRGNHQVVADLLQKIGSSALDVDQKVTLARESLEFQAALATGGGR